MKTVAILANYTDTYSVSPSIIESHKKLTEVFGEHGIQLRRVSIHSFDQERGVFRDYIDVNTLGEFQIFYEDYTPDYIWNRSSPGVMHNYTVLERSGYRVVPDIETVQLASDKYEMSLFFGKYHPKTVLLGDFLGDHSVQSTFDDTVVLKPIRANSGKGIQFLKKQSLIDSADKYEGLTSLYIVQEFKDFSGGIPGLIDGMHDLRLVFIGGIFSHSTIRTPKKGSLKSNVGAGGNEISIQKDAIPQEVFLLVEKIIENMNISRESSIFSLDFGYCLGEKKWYIFELNFSPGVQVLPDTKDMFYNIFFVDLAQFFNKKLGNNI